MSKLKFNQAEFNRKAQHILDTEVGPQTERAEKAKRYEAMSIAELREELIQQQAEQIEIMQEIIDTQKRLIELLKQEAL